MSINTFTSHVPVRLNSDSGVDEYFCGLGLTNLLFCFVVVVVVVVLIVLIIFSLSLFMLQLWLPSIDISGCLTWDQ